MSILRVLCKSEWNAGFNQLSFATKPRQWKRRPGWFWDTPLWGPVMCTCVRRWLTRVLPHKSGSEPNGNYNSPNKCNAVTMRTPARQPHDKLAENTLPWLKFVNLRVLSRRAVAEDLAAVTCDTRWTMPFTPSLSQPVLKKISRGDLRTRTNSDRNTVTETHSDRNTVTETHIDWNALVNNQIQKI